MNHVLVLTFLITVLVGAWTILVTWQRYQRHGLSQARHLFHYAVAFNILAFGYLVAHYAFTNLIGSNPLEFPRFVLALSVGVFPMQAGLTWASLRLGRDLQGRRFPVFVRHAFTAGTAAFGISYVAGLTVLLQHGGFLWLVRTHMMLGLVTTAVLVAVFLGLATCRSGVLTADQLRSVRRLGAGLLVGHLALVGSAALPKSAHLPVLATALLWLNCVPLLWLRRGFDAYRQGLAAKGDGELGVAALVRQHGVTRREREVMELIAQGKSNKEIEAQLCISFSTVKNHAYSLYRKLGVNSRAQLVRLVMTSVPRSDQ